MSSFTAGTSFKKYNDERKWYLIDAQDLILGRLASQIAMMLRGKDKSDFTPHIDSGNHVIVINADKVKVTGKKLDQDMFYWHTNYPGGIKQRSKGKILTGRFPERLLIKSVERMMPKDSPLARKQMKHLHVYAGGEHKQQAQTPIVVDISKKNRKNKG